MKEIFVLMVFSLIPISLFGMAAFLIYKQVDGWGWFLLAVVLVAGSANIKYSENDESPSKSEEAS